MKELEARQLGGHLAGPGLRTVLWAADWCGPCQTYKPLLAAVEQEVEMNLAVVDVGQVLADVLTGYGVVSVPTLTFHRDGRVVGRLTGTHARETVIETVEELS